VLASSLCRGKICTTELLLDYMIRTKTMRGLKNDDKVLGHCYLSENLRGNDGMCDLCKVIRDSDLRKKLKNIHTIFGAIMT